PRLLHASAARRSALELRGRRRARDPLPATRRSCQTRSGVLFRRRSTTYAPGYVYRPGAALISLVRPNGRSLLPGDVQLQVVRDQSRYMCAALHEINWHLLIGSCLACLVVLAFMRSWRSTLIAGIAIPARAWR